MDKIIEVEKQTAWKNMRNSFKILKNNVHECKIPFKFQEYLKNYKRFGVSEGRMLYVRPIWKRPLQIKHALHAVNKPKKAANPYESGALRAKLLLQNLRTEKYEIKIHTVDLRFFVNAHRTSWITLRRWEKS